MDLDGYCRRVVREAAAHLNEGGFLQMVLEWVQVRGQSWTDRLREWVADLGCDVWVLRSYVGEPAAYAHERTKDDYAASPDAATAKFEDWIAYYRERQVEQISGGILAMRRRTGANWVRFEEVPLNAGEPFGDSILEIFATQDVLASDPSDEHLQSLKPKLSTAARLEQDFRVAKRQWASESSKLTLKGPLPVVDCSGIPGGAIPRPV